LASLFAFLLTLALLSPSSPDERTDQRDEGLFFMYYNFGRIHQTLRVISAMEAGVANHVWSIEEIVSLLG
jgi:hypothetical protein